MEELYLNDILFDLPINTVAQTFQINDIGSLDDRQANYSNNIKLHKTPTNIAGFKMLGIAGNTSRIPYKNVNIKYVVDGIELITSGVGIIKNTNGYFNLVIYDGNIDMVTLLDDLHLNDLDFSAYNHNLTTDIWLNSLTNTSGYIYGIGQFYEKDTLNPIKISLQNASFYVHTLFDMIFTQQGYTISGNFLTDTDFKSRVISMANGYERNSIEDKTQVYSNVPNVAINETFTEQTIKSYLIESYTALTSDVYTLVVDGEILLGAGSNFYMDVYVGGAFAERQSITSDNLTFNVQVLTGQIIEVYIRATSEILLTVETIAFDTSAFTSFTFFKNTIYTAINFNLMIGELKQIDFVKDIMQRFGLIFRKTRNKNNYEFIQMKTLLTDITNAENWSGKYATFENELYKSGYAQTNIAKYKYDDNDSNTDQTFADGEFYINDVNLSATKTVFTSIFKASEIYKNTYKLQQWELKDNEIVPKDDGNRIFKILNINDTIYFRYNDSIENSAILIATIPYLNFDTINYQKEIDTNYKEVNSLLEDYKNITVTFNLSLLDIYALDFFKLKYIDKLGKYYYLNKVSNYKKGKITKCELIEIGDIILNDILMSATATGEATYNAILSVLADGELSGSATGYATATAILRTTGTIAFDMSVTGGDEVFVCSLDADTTYYHNGIGTYPSINDTIYTDISGTTPLNGNSDFWNLADTNYIQIDSNGVVINKSSC